MKNKQLKEKKKNTMLLKDSVKIFSVCILTLLATKAEWIDNELYKMPTEIALNGMETLLVNVSRVNGGEVVRKIVPFQVSLQVYRRQSWRHFCGGSIISESHILTAAHCVDKIKAEDIHVVAGTLTWNTGGQRHRGTAKRVHPHYSLRPRIVNDIALLKVQPAFNLRHSTIGTISLGSNTRIGDGVQVRLTGWGATTPTASEGLPNHLQQLDYQTISNAECGRKGFRVTRSEICALSSKGQGSCMVS